MSEPTASVPAPPGGGGAPQPYGPYLLLEKIGSGGMAEVFRAVRKGPEGFVRLFAFKRIIPRHAESREFVRDVLQRGAAVGAAEPSQPGAGLRLRRGRRLVLPGDGVPQGAHGAVGDAQPARAPAAVPGAGRRPTSAGRWPWAWPTPTRLRGARGQGAEPGPPRHQPLEHHAAQERRGEGAGLRHRQGARLAHAPDPGRAGEGQALLRPARAAQVPAARRAGRRVRPGRDPVGDADHAEAVRRHAPTSTRSPT